MAKYKLKSAISLDGVIHAAGTTVELNNAQAAELEECLDTTPTIDVSEGSGDTGPNFGKMTKKQLVAELEARGAEFDPNAKNADLIAILEGLEAAPEAPASTPEGTQGGEGSETF